MDKEGEGRKEHERAGEVAGRRLVRFTSEQKVDDIYTTTSQTVRLLQQSGTINGYSTKSHNYQ